MPYPGTKPLRPTNATSATSATSATKCLLSASLMLAACEPALSVGEWTCEQDDAAVALNEPRPLPAPWSTGFEAEFCDYAQPAGFCYGDANASYATVTSPVHSGHYAAAFRIATDDARARQARCVRQGILPRSAYYGAWYFIPNRVTHSALWNLFHFQGGDFAAMLHGLWDVSLENGDSGALSLIVYDFLNGRTHQAMSPVPIGAWFHLELYLKRASDATGEVALYQNDQQLLRLTNLITDDSSWGQWYVGNLASRLRPPDSTLYVDDVTIRVGR